MPEVYKSTIWQASFEIGVVWEDVDKILNHSVAEVILLLEEESGGKRRHCARLRMCRNIFFFFFLTSTTDDFDFFLILHLPQSEPCVVSACADSSLSEKRPGDPQLSPSPKCYWVQQRYQFDPHRHWNRRENIIGTRISLNKHHADFQTFEFFNVELWL